MEYENIDYKGRKYHKEAPLDWQLKRYTNKKFGKLLVECPVWVEGMVTPPSSTNAIWLTHCDCGNDTFADGYYLCRGMITSCGCKHQSRYY